MNWRQLVVEPHAESLAAVEAFLNDAGALALTLQDAGDEPLLEPPPGSNPLWQRTRIVALFSADADLTGLAARLSAQFEAQVHNIGIDTLADRAWELEWRKDFKPMCFGTRLWVTPVDGLDTLPEDAIAVVLEPGLAFGTGTHPTTALCLRWLDGRTLQAQHVLDYGCGSGILAIAAARLGAASVTATDIDPQALLATRENALRNEVAHISTVTPDTLAPGSYDVVLANIIAGTLITLADELIGLCRPDGHLVLSGLLPRQVEAVCDRYRGQVEFLPVVQLGEWCLLHGTRRHDAVD